MSKEVLVAEEENTSLVQSFDLTGELPDLSEAREVPADLAGSYWTPAAVGEKKLVFYQGVEVKTYLDQNSDDLVELSTALFIEQREDKSVAPIYNASTRLVAAIEDAEKKGQITKGTPLSITYLGEKENSRNSKKSHRWQIRPLSA